MLDNQFIQILLGGVGSLVITYLGKLLVTRREHYKFNNEQLESNSRVLTSHTQIIADLQTLIGKMSVDSDMMRDKIIQLRTDNSILEDKLDIMSDKIGELEKENSQIMVENNNLKKQLKELGNH